MKMVSNFDDKLRILVVEDEDWVRKLTVRMLKENGFIPFEAATAKDALALFEKSGRNFEIVFSDIILPDKNGLELVDELITRKPDLHVLITSGYFGNQKKWKTIRDRGYNFLQKPYHAKDLLSRLNALVK